jgi:beta-lactamase class A
VSDLIDTMIVRTENDAADDLMNRVMDKGTGPIKVTEDLKKLGFLNTFIAGYFYPGAQIVTDIKSPANSRTDVNTNPDKYNQTTPLDMGQLLFDIYQCAQNNGGSLMAAFPGKITQSKCQSMISNLSHNRSGVLMQAGLPEGTNIANQHGWITNADGLLHTVGDAGVIYTPGGNYILSIFVHDPQQLSFDSVNELFAKLTKATYNYYNINRP